MLDYYDEGINLEKILLELEQRYKDHGDEFIVDKPLGYLKAILAQGEAYRKELCGVRSAGIPEFRPGDLVVDCVTGKNFRVVKAQVSFGDDKYQWYYSMGGYYIPQTDLRRTYE